MTRSFSFTCLVPLGMGCKPTRCLPLAMVLLSIIRKNKHKERELRILFLGLDNSGKSTILKQIQGKDIHSVSPTLGFDIFTLLHNG